MLVWIGASLGQRAIILLLACLVGLARHMDIRVAVTPFLGLGTSTGADDFLGPCLAGWIVLKFTRLLNFTGRVSPAFIGP